MEKILEVNIDSINSPELEKQLEKRVNFKKDSLIISKVNSEFLLRAYSDSVFCEALNDSGLRVADGVGVLWAAKYLSIPLIKIPVLRKFQAVWQMIYSGASLVFYPQYCRNPLPHAFRGVDMMRLMLDFAEKERLSVYLFGAPEETLEKAVSILNTQYPCLNIAGYRHGYDFKDEEVIKNINNSKAEMLFVALGSPAQEYWIRDNIKNLNSVKIAVGEGGSFEFIAGTYKRAPRWMRTLGIEWLWRLFANKNTTTTEKSRISRVWKAVPVFIYTVVKYKLRKN